MHDIDEQRIFLILRLLFETDKMPDIHIGAPDTDPSADWPLFPLVVRDDIPFMVVNGYALAGIPQSPVEHIDTFARHGRLREKPLAPVGSPLDAADALKLESDWNTGMIRLQALWMLGAVAEADECALFPQRATSQDETWRRLRKAAGAPRWDAATGRFRVP
jgi:hypothetical protein